MTSTDTVTALVGRDCVTRERVFVRITSTKRHTFKHGEATSTEYDAVQLDGMVVGYGCASIHTWGRIDLRILDRVAPEPLHWMPRDIRLLAGLWRRFGNYEPLTDQARGEIKRLMSLPTGDVPQYITDTVTNP